MQTKLAILIILTGAITALVSCGEAPQAEGDIVSLSPVVTEILYELGAGERIMANTKFCNYPEDAKHKIKVADFHNVNEEEILRLNPGLIIDTDSKTHEKMWGRMAKAGLRVEHFPIDTIEQIPAAYIGIGRAIGEEERGRKLAQRFRDDRNALKARYANVSRRPRVLFLLGYRNLDTVGRNTFIDDFITNVGGANIIEKDGWINALSFDVILANPPDIIFVSINGDEINPRKIAEVKNHLKMFKAPVHVVSGDEACRPGPRFMAAWKKIGAILHPEVETN